MVRNTQAAFVGVLFLPQLLLGSSARQALPRSETLIAAASTQRHSLLQIANNLQRGTLEVEGAARASTGAAGKAGKESLDPRDPAFFDAFNFAESKYDPADDSDIPSLEGWNPTDTESRAEGTSLSAAWYDESPSDGPQQALQTHYPALATGDPALAPEFAKVKDSEWFERSINELDVYGRPKAPPIGDVAQAQMDEQELFERVVEGNLTCATPGCSANVTLQVHDPSTEFISTCALSLSVHATDFDDNYSGERVLNLLANGRAVGGDCFPGVNGCVSKLSREQLYPCVRDFPVDTIISSEGALRVSAGIPTEVDECPYNGQLLFARATVTCQVGKYTTTTTTTTYNPPVSPQMPVAPLPQIVVTNTYGRAALKCAERGCRAEAALVLNSSTLTLNNCTLEVFVNQTDFDNKDDAVETLSVNVTGQQVVQNVKPGKNPCRSEYDGEPLTAGAKLYHAVKGMDVTEAARKGPIIVTAKISDQVDECASQGYLLDAEVVVTCSVSTMGALLTDGKVTVPEILSMNEALLLGSDLEAKAAINEVTGASEYFTVNASSNASSNTTSNTTSNASSNVTSGATSNASSNATSNANSNTSSNATSGATSSTTSNSSASLNTTRNSTPNASDKPAEPPASG